MSSPGVVPEVKVPFAFVELAGGSEAVAHGEPTAWSETSMSSPGVVPEVKASPGKVSDPLVLARLGAGTARARRHHALQGMHDGWTGAAGWLSEQALGLMAKSRTNVTFNVTSRTDTITSSAGSWILMLVVIFLVILGICCLVPGPNYLSLLAPSKSAPAKDDQREFFGMKMPTATSPSQNQLSRPRLPKTPTPPPPGARELPMPPARSPRDSVEAFLCPGLVVPSGCECTLSVPRLTPQFQPKLSRTAMSQVTIDDIKGVPVFRASFMLPSWGSPQSTAAAALSSREGQQDQGSRCLVLTSTTSESTIFAFCRDCRVELGFEPAALAIHNASGRPFGSLRPYRDQGVGGGFEVVTAGGFWVHLSSNENGILTAIDRQGRSLAAAEPSSESPGNRTVRIGPLVDAGLLTLAILAGDLMESTLAEQLAMG